MNSILQIYQGTLKVAAVPAMTSRPLVEKIHFHWKNRLTTRIEILRPIFNPFSGWTWSTVAGLKYSTTAPAIIRAVPTASSRSKLTRSFHASWNSPRSSWRPSRSSIIWWGPSRIASRARWTCRRVRGTTGRTWFYLRYPMTTIPRTLATSATCTTPKNHKNKDVISALTSISKKERPADRTPSRSTRSQ